MKKKTLLTGIGITLFTAQAVFAQQGKNDPPVMLPTGQSEYSVQIRERQQKAAERLGGLDENGMIKQPAGEKPYRSPKRPKDKEDGESEAEARENHKAAEAEVRENNEAIEKMLRAPMGYYEKYAAFLTAEHTGLGRIFPDRNCGKGKTVKVQEIERCADVPPIEGGGSLFSFRINKFAAHPLLKYKPFVITGISDIHFANDKFFVGDESVQVIIAALGSIGLAEVIAKSDAVKFLDGIKPSKTIAELSVQNQELKKGIDKNGISYANVVPVKLDETYILRSIGYRRESRLSALHNTDLTVAFKVIGRETDGSIIILWKQLREENASVLRSK